jgi:hypothetical protein
MTQIILNDLYKQVKELMAEYGIGDNSLFIEGQIKQYKHHPGNADKELKVAMFLEEGAGVSTTIKQVSGTNVEGLLMQLKGILMEWKASKAEKQAVDPVIVM